MFGVALAFDCIVVLLPVDGGNMFRLELALHCFNRSDIIFEVKPSF